MRNYLIHNTNGLLAVREGVRRPVEPGVATAGVGSTRRGVWIHSWAGFFFGRPGRLGVTKEVGSSKVPEADLLIDRLREALLARFFVGDLHQSIYKATNILNNRIPVPSGVSRSGQLVVLLVTFKTVN